MRILILDTSPMRRGAQVFAYDLAECLKTLGHDVSRVYLFLSKEKSTLPIGESDLALFFFENSLSEIFPSFQSRLLGMLAEKVDDFQPEVILCNGSRALKYGAWLKLIYGLGEIKLVGRFIDDAVFWNPGGFKKWVYSFWINQFDAFVCVSKNSLESFKKHYDFKKPSSVIHRVVDPKKFVNAPSRAEARKSLDLNERGEVLLFLGNLTSQKRPDRFIEIVAKLSETRPYLKALIVGDGVMREELEKKVRSTKYKVSSTKNSSDEADRISNDENHPTPVANSSDIGHRTSCINFFGYQQDVSTYLAAADLLILTSDTEGLPGVVLEAAYFQVPTVATEVGGIRECLVDGQTGFLIPDRSVDSFSEKIKFLLDRPEKLIQMGQKAHNFVSEKFRMDLVVNQYLDFFSSLFHSKSSKK